MSGHSTYEPKTGFTRWLDKRLPIIRLGYDSFVAYPTPRNLNYWWTFGAMLSLCLVVQIITGVILAMHYTPHIDLAMDSVQRFKRDVSFGWLIQPIHAVERLDVLHRGVRAHVPGPVLRVLQGAARNPLDSRLRDLPADGLHGVPWLHAAVGPDELLGRYRHHQPARRALPLVGESIKNWLMGGFAIDQPTLSRFFSLHYLLPFVIAGVVALHVWALHEAGQNNPAGVDPRKDADIPAGQPKDTVPFTPHATMKDLFATALFLILFAVFVFYMPDALGHADNYIPANALQTPPEIVPEWYLLPFYAILRAVDFNIGRSIPSLAACSPCSRRSGVVHPALARHLARALDALSPGGASVLPDLRGRVLGAWLVRRAKPRQNPRQVRRVQRHAELG